jgi:hypothetical protein
MKGHQVTIISKKKVFDKMLNCLQKKKYRTNSSNQLNKKKEHEKMRTQVVGQLRGGVNQLLLCLNNNAHFKLFTENLMMITIIQGSKQ